MALVAGQQYDAAVRELQALRAAGDDTLETLTLLGDCHRLAGRYAEALQAFSAAVAKNAAAPRGTTAGERRSPRSAGRTRRARRSSGRCARPQTTRTHWKVSPISRSRGATSRTPACASTRSPPATRVIRASR